MAFLSVSDLRSTKNPVHFVCRASAMGLRRGDFPGTIETDVGNCCSLHLERSLSDEYGIFVGAAYRQSGGYEVSVFLD